MFLTFLNPCSSEMPSCFPKRIIGAMEKHQSVYCVILLLKMFSITLQPKPAQIPSEASAHDCAPTVSCCRWLYVCTVWSQQVTILSASGRWDPFFPLCSLFNLPLWDFSSREFAIVGVTLWVWEFVLVQVHPLKVHISFLITTSHTYAHLLCLPPVTSALIGWSPGWLGLVFADGGLNWLLTVWTFCHSCLCFVFTCLWAGLPVLGVALLCVTSS